MAPHSSTLAWEIPWMEELVGYSPWGRKESDTTEQKKKKSGLSVIKGFKCCYHWLFTTVKVPVLSFLFLLHIISFYKILLKG